MESVIFIFYVLSFIFVLIVGLVIYKKLPDKKDRLRFIIPILICILISVIFCAFGLRVPSCKFGRFM